MTRSRSTCAVCGFSEDTHAESDHPTAHAFVSTVIAEFSLPVGDSDPLVRKLSAKLGEVAKAHALTISRYGAALRERDAARAALQTVARHAATQALALAEDRSGLLGELERGEWMWCAETEAWEEK